MRETWIKYSKPLLDIYREVILWCMGLVFWQNVQYISVFFWWVLFHGELWGFISNTKIQLQKKKLVLFQFSSTLKKTNVLASRHLSSENSSLKIFKMLVKIICVQSTVLIFWSSVMKFENAMAFRELANFKMLVMRIFV